MRHPCLAPGMRIIDVAEFIPIPGDAFLAAFPA